MSAPDLATAILSTASSVDPAPPSSNSSNDTPNSPDSSTDSSTTTEEAVDSPDSPDGESSESSEGGDQTPKVPSTAEIRASLKAFREANPDHAQAAKLLNDGYSRYEAYKAVIPTVEDARNMVAQLDALGGFEGIADLQSTLQAVEETDSLLDAGDPKVIDQIIEDSPDGFQKIVPHAVNKLREMNPEAFNAMVRPHLIRGLAEANFPQVVDYLISQLGDKPEVQKVVNSMKNWFENQKMEAERTSTDFLTPEREKFAKEKADHAATVRKDFEAGIETAVASHLNTTLGTALRPYSAALNALPPAIRQDVARACITELASALRADKAYQTAVNAAMKSRRPDRDKIIVMNKTAITNKAAAVIAKVVKNYSLTPGTPSKKTGKADTKQPVVQTGVTKLSKPPKDTDIDWNHPNMSQEAYIRHRAVLKNGRFVSW